MKAKKIIIAVVAILVVLGGVFAGLWFFTDVLNFMKPDKQTAGVVNKGATELEEALHLEGARFSNYSEFLNKYKEEFDLISNKSYSSKINMTANLKISELDSDVQNIINKSKISMESNVDADKERTQNKVSLSSGNSEILTLDLVTNGTTVGIGCKDLYDKYITVSLEDLIDYLKENYEGEYDVDELEALIGSIGNMSSKVNPYDLLYISDEDLKHFDETYRDGYKALISSDSYTTKKDVTVEVDGKDVKADAHYVTLTGKQCYEFIDGLGKIVKDDDVLRRIITEKINLMMEAAGQDKIKESDVKELVDELVDELVGSLDNIKDYEDSAIQLAFYTADNKTVKAELNSIEDVKNMDEVETLLTLEFADSKNVLTINAGRNTIAIVNDISKDSADEKAGSFKVTYNNRSVASMTYDIVDKEDKSKIDIAVSIPSESVNFAVNFETDGNVKEEEVKVKGSVSFAYGSEYAKINFDGTIDATKDVSVPELTSKNSLNILDLSEKELQTEMEKILKKASEVLPDRLKSIGINVKAEDIYANPNAATPETSEPAAATDDAA